jgi:prophage antirepressor-like protein
MNLTVFAFEEQQVRFVGTFGLLAWVTQDVADALEINNIRQSLAVIDDNGKGVCKKYIHPWRQQILVACDRNRALQVNF